MHIIKRNQDTKNILICFTMIIFLFAIFSCTKPKPAGNQSKEVNKDTIDKNPTVKEKSIIDTSPENHFYKIPYQKIEDSPNRAWNPIWQYSGQNGGSIGSSSIMINTRNLLLLTDPLVDFDEFQKVVPPDKYFEEIIALNPNNKEVIWKYRINEITSSQILVQGENLYISTSMGPNGKFSKFFLICLNKNTGKENWKCPINGVTETNLIFSNNYLYFGTQGYNGNFIVCVDTSNGKIVYQSHVPNIHFDYNINFICIGDTLYYSTPETPNIYGFNTASQLSFLVWKPNNTNEIEYMTRLTYVDPCLLFEGTKGNSSTLYAINLKENKMDWKINFDTNNINYPSEPEYDDKNIYFSSNRFLASIDRETRKLNWFFCVENQDIHELTLDKDKIYLTIEIPPYEARDTSHFKERYLLALDEKTGKILWKMQKGVYLNRIFQDKLLVIEKKNLYMIDPN